MYYAKYKCRLCGKEFIGEITESKKLATNCMLYITTNMEKFLDKNTIIHPEQLDTHFCEDGSLGLADFLGFEIKENCG